LYVYALAPCVCASEQTTFGIADIVVLVLLIMIVLFVGRV